MALDALRGLISGAGNRQSVGAEGSEKPIGYSGSSLLETVVNALTVGFRNLREQIRDEASFDSPPFHELPQLAPVSLYQRPQPAFDPALFSPSEPLFDVHEDAHRLKIAMPRSRNPRLSDAELDEVHDLVSSLPRDPSEAFQTLEASYPRASPAVRKVLDLVLDGYPRAQRTSDR